MDKVAEQEQETTPEVQPSAPEQPMEILYSKPKGPSKSELAKKRMAEKAKAAMREKALKEKEMREALPKQPPGSVVLSTTKAKKDDNVSNADVDKQDATNSSTDLGAAEAKKAAEPKRSILRNKAQSLGKLVQMQKLRIATCESEMRDKIFKARCERSSRCETKFC